MEDLCLRGEEICDILKVVSAVLKLGNLRFVPTTNMDGTEGCSIANEYGKEGEKKLDPKYFFLSLRSLIKENIHLFYWNFSFSRV